MLVGDQERGENTGQRAGEVEFADKPVGEHDAQRARTRMFDRGHSSENSHTRRPLKGSMVSRAAGT